MVWQVAVSVCQSTTLAQISQQIAMKHSWPLQRRRILMSDDFFSRSSSSRSIFSNICWNILVLYLLHGLGKKFRFQVMYPTDFDDLLTSTNCISVSCTPFTKVMDMVNICTCEVITKLLCGCRLLVLFDVMTVSMTDSSTISVWMSAQLLKSASCFK